jgi:hypothetical protein
MHARTAVCNGHSCWHLTAAHTLHEHAKCIHPHSSTLMWSVNQQSGCALLNNERPVHSGRDSSAWQYAAHRVDVFCRIHLHGWQFGINCFWLLQTLKSLASVQDASILYLTAQSGTEQHTLTFNAHRD